MAPGKCKEHTGILTPSTVNRISWVPLVRSAYGMCSTRPGICFWLNRRCRAAAILSVIVPPSGAVPSKKGTSCLIARAISSSLNQTKFSKTTGKFREASSTSKIIVASLLAVRSLYPSFLNNPDCISFSAAASTISGLTGSPTLSPLASMTCCPVSFLRPTNSTRRKVNFCCAWQGELDTHNNVKSMAANAAQLAQWRTQNWQLRIFLIG